MMNVQNTPIRKKNKETDVERLERMSRIAKYNKDISRIQNTDVIGIIRHEIKQVSSPTENTTCDEQKINAPDAKQHHRKKKFDMGDHIKCIDDVPKMVVKTDLRSYLFDLTSLLKTLAKTLTNSGIDIEVDESITMLKKMISNIIIANRSTIHEESLLSEVGHELLEMIQLFPNSPCIDAAYTSLINDDIDVIVSSGALAPAIPKVELVALENKVIERKINKIKVNTYIPQSKFKVGQIVGARDSNGKWWLSEVLHLLEVNDGNGIWYYVNFKGFDMKANEWVQVPRICKFNPKRDKLYR